MAKKDPNSPLRYIKYYPREFHDQTTVNDNGYPIYRRWRVIDDETVEFEKRGARLDNR